MTSPDHRPSTEEQTADATRDLTDLKRQTDEARAEVAEARAHLAQLHLQIEAVEHHLDNSEAMQLLEANENLVLSTLRAQIEADTCAETLKQVSHSAQLDTLTELPNRELLLDRFAHAIAMTRRHGGQLALLFVDMNNFKMINDTVGHSVGDQVLQRAAQCLSSVVREADTVSRHGGDEFLAHKVISALGMPFRIGEHILRLTASIGICVYPDHGDTPAITDRSRRCGHVPGKAHGQGQFCFSSGKRRT
jgi:diguanylate cyclase